MNYKHFLDIAKQALGNGWRNGYTVPHPKLYPFQWNWDSGFVAIGYSYYDSQKAYSEMRHLFKGQWNNGFLPHIIYHHPSSSYFPQADVYRCQVASAYPGTVPTSGLTQPPVHGYVLKRLFEQAKNKDDAIVFLKELFPKVLKYHQYLYTNRDPNNEGLIYIVHNWESGTDNSPAWDSIWKRIDPHVAEQTFERRDIQIVNPDQRPHKREYDYYLHLINKLIEFKYDDKRIAKEHDFLIQDPLFNSLLVKSNDSLAEIAEIIGENNTIEQLKAWSSQTRDGMNTKLYDSVEKIYKYYDIVAKERIDVITACGLAVPLFSQIPSTQDQAQSIISNLNHEIFRGANNEYYLCPTFNTQDSRFESRRYWRGPIWLNINWMLLYGLESYGEKDLEKAVRDDTFSIIEEQGLWEYYEPNKKVSKTQRHGYGGENFSSWTPALLIDLLNRYNLLD